MTVIRPPPAKEYFKAKSLHHALSHQWQVCDQPRILPLRLAPFATLRDWECFDADTGKDSAREIREYFIPDFSTGRTTTLVRKPSSACAAI
jgi:hypothetical protein